jgi:hypothetical protein
MKAAPRTAIKEYRRNKNLKIQPLTGFLFPAPANWAARLIDAVRDGFMTQSI